MPAVLRQKALSLKAPEAENIAGGKIVLDQLIAPILREPFGVFHHFLQHSGMGRVQIMRIP